MPWLYCTLGMIKLLLHASERALLLQLTISCISGPNGLRGDDGGIATSASPYILRASNHSLAMYGAYLQVK